MSLVCLNVCVSVPLFVRLCFYASVRIERVMVLSRNLLYFI